MAFDRTVEEQEAVLDWQLVTDRLALRRFNVADVDALFALNSDPEVMRYLNGGLPTPRAVIERTILPRYLADYARFPGFGRWATVERSSGAFVGWLSLRPRECGNPGDAELGYRLCRAAWGRGYATEGARALLHKGFAELGVREVIAVTYEENRASRRVMEKLGMTLARRYRLTQADLAAGGVTNHLPSQELWDGDEVEYALDKPEWERREAVRRAAD